MPQLNPDQYHKRPLGGENLHVVYVYETVAGTEMRRVAVSVGVQVDSSHRNCIECEMEIETGAGRALGASVIASGDECWTL